MISVILWLRFFTAYMKMTERATESVVFFWINILKKEIKKVINFLKKDCKYPIEEIETYYNSSGLAGLLFMTELEKFSKNIENI